jgi:hypothetical protein
VARSAVERGTGALTLSPAGGTDAPPVDGMLEDGYEAVARHVPATDQVDLAGA